MVTRRAFTRALAALGLIVIGGRPSAAAPATHKVTIDGASFQPQTLTVKVGDVVEWLNKDPYPHTATCTAKTGGFDSKEIAPDKSWRYTAKQVGEFPYVCTLHTTMKGTLKVTKS